MSPDPFAVLSVLLWIAAAPRLRDLGPRASSSRRSVAVAITALAVVTTAFAEVPGRIIDDISGVTYLQDLVGRGALMVAAVAAQCIFLTLTPATAPGARTVGPTASEGRRPHAPPLSWAGTAVGQRVVVLLLALALLVSAFIVAVTTVPLDPGRYFLVDQSEEVPLTIYVITFTALLGWCFLDLIRAWLRLRHQVTGPLRTGLGYVVLRLLGMVAERASWSSVTPVTGWGCQAAGAAAALLVTAGISWHTVDAWRAKARRWWLARHRLLVLGPLWRDLVAAVPGIALQPPGRWGAITDRLKVTGLPWRVYRRVIEIHDASLALQRRARAARPGRAKTAPPVNGLEATVVRVREELDPARPTDAAEDLRLYEVLDQEAQIDRLVDIAEDHAHRRTTITRPRTHRDDHEDHA